MPVELPARERKHAVAGLIGWSVAAAVFLFLCWFVPAVGAPLYKTHKVVSGYSMQPQPSTSISKNNKMTQLANSAIAALGGPERAAGRLGLYLRLPRLDAEQKDKAVEILGFCGPSAIPPLLLALRDEQSPCAKSGSRATCALLQVVFDEEAQKAKAVPGLTELLGSSRPWVREGAITVLAQIGPQARAATPELIRLLDDPDARVRSSTAFAFSGIGPEATGAVPALIRNLGDPDESVRSGAALALGRIGASPETAMPALLKMLEDKDHGPRMYAAYSLGRFGLKSKVAVPKIIERLSDAHPLVRYYAAAGLRDVGPEAREAVPKLIERLADPDEGVRGGAAEALAAIGQKEALPALEKAAQEWPQNSRWVAERALQKLRGETAPAGKALDP